MEFLKSWMIQEKKKNAATPSPVTGPITVFMFSPLDPV
jgi:hypothetical protein